MVCEVGCSGAESDPGRMVSLRGSLRGMRQTTTRRPLLVTPFWSVLFASIMSLAWLGCRDAPSSPEETLEEPRAERESADEKDEERKVSAPPITKERLEGFLACEKDVINLRMAAYGDMARAAMETAQGRRLQKMAESEGTRELVGQLLGGAAADHEEEGKELKDSLEKAEKESKAKLEARLVECGFEGLKEWEAFGKRLQPLRRWRLNKEIHARSHEARDQMASKLDEAVAKGRLTEEQRDQQIAAFPNIAPPERPELEPPLTDAELEILDGIEVEQLVSGALPAR